MHGPLGISSASSGRNKQTPFAARSPFEGNPERQKGLWSFLTWAFLLPQLIVTASFAEHYSQSAVDGEPESTTRHPSLEAVASFDGPDLGSGGLGQSPEAAEATNTVLAGNQTAHALLDLRLGDISHHFFEAKAAIVSPGPDVDGSGGDLNQNSGTSGLSSDTSENWSGGFPDTTGGELEKPVVVAAVIDSGVEQGGVPGNSVDPTAVSPQQPEADQTPPNSGFDPPVSDLQSIAHNTPGTFDIDHRSQPSDGHDGSGSASAPSLAAYLGFDAHVQVGGLIVENDLTLALNHNPAALVDISLTTIMNASPILQPILSLDTHFGLDSIVNNASDAIANTSSEVLSIASPSSDHISPTNDFVNHVQGTLSDLTGIALVGADHLVTNSSVQPVGSVSGSLGLSGSTSDVAHPIAVVNVVTDLSESVGVTQTGHLSSGGSLTFATAPVSAVANDLFTNGAYTEYNVALQSNNLANTTGAISDVTSQIAPSTLQAVTGLLSSSTAADHSTDTVSHPPALLEEDLHLRGH